MKDSHVSEAAASYSASYSTFKTWGVLFVFISPWFKYSSVEYISVYAAFSYFLKSFFNYYYRTAVWQCNFRCSGFSFLELVTK